VLEVVEGEGLELVGAAAGPAATAVQQEEPGYARSSGSVQASVVRKAEMVDQKVKSEVKKVRTITPNMMMKRIRGCR
jgi:ribosomal protein S25